MLRRVGVLTGFHPSRVGSYGLGPLTPKCPLTPGSSPHSTFPLTKAPLGLL